MGSKSSLLRGELGNILLEEIGEAERFVDLFSGSGSVGHFVAENTMKPVLSVDLQRYSRVLAGCITERTSSLEAGSEILSWTSSVRRAVESDGVYASLQPADPKVTEETVFRERELAAAAPSRDFITSHYGGHYFSLRQAFALDALFQRLPHDAEQRSVGLAALVHTASVCAAAPGHTAQPFQPTSQLLPHIQTSWSRDVLRECERQVAAIAARFANVKGEAIVGDAMMAIDEVKENDLVFCDPPYSAAQYSRFYHVLEGIARGGWPDVSGAGRAPSRGLRSTSAFSMKSTATGAMDAMLRRLREKSCRVVITFPEQRASNGLSGKDIANIASAQWTVATHAVDSIHSTMGGSSKTTGGRGGRRRLEESVLVLSPKPGAGGLRVLDWADNPMPSATVAVRAGDEKSNGQTEMPVLTSP